MTLRLDFTQPCNHAPNLVPLNFIKVHVSVMSGEEPHQYKPQRSRSPYLVQSLNPVFTYIPHRMRRTGATNGDPGFLFNRTVSPFHIAVPLCLKHITSD